MYLWETLSSLSTTFQVGILKTIAGYLPMDNNSNSNNNSDNNRQFMIILGHFDLYLVEYDINIFKVPQM